jgi:putative phosphoribosyl transferase
MRRRPGSWQETGDGGSPEEVGGRQARFRLPPPAREVLLAPILRRRLVRFTDRHEAGQLLAERLLTFKEQRPVVLALPRGGVPTGFEIARHLAAPLDLVLVRKIGAPDREELAIGAIADGNDPELVIDRELVRELRVPPDYLDQAKADALREIERRRRVYLGARPPVDVAGRTAIVVDDGVATGATMLAALRATRRRGPARLVLATPVAPPATFRRLRREADEAICLHTPMRFFAVGQFYDQFPQLGDDEVIELLDRARPFAATARA